MQAQYKGQYSGLPNRRWGVGIPRLLHMAWYPSGHKGLDLKSCVSASIWLVGSNPTHAAASQRSLHVAMLFSLILYICSVGQAAKTWDFQSQNRVSITLRSTIWLCGRTGRVAALSRRSLWDHAPPESPLSGVLVQKSRTPACRAGGHGFKSRIRRHSSRVLLRIEVMGNT